MAVPPETEESIRRLNAMVLDLLRTARMTETPAPDSRMDAYLLDRHLHVVPKGESYDDSSR